MVEKAPDEASKAEGALRQGDLYMNRFEYDQALRVLLSGDPLLPRAGQEIRFGAYQSG